MSPATDSGAAVADAQIARPRPPPARQPLIVLQPVAPPELDAIQIHDNLFAIGRTEAPFDAYAPELVADLSRRHARIFCEHGAVYLADLGSKNGTTVNGAPLKQAIATLHSGDLLGLGSALSYRVQLEEAALAPPRTARLASLTLTPEHAELGLQPIVVTEFPFMISKADATFARYQGASAQQLNYLSRRHAHIFLKGGQPWIEDLGSTNGTFVDGVRLDEHAVALHDDAIVGFGGHHFVYRVGVQWEAPAPDPTLTRLGVTAAPATAGTAATSATKAPPAADDDKTTFVAAADSFLDIFCVDQAPEAAPDPAGAAARADEAAAVRPRGKGAALASELLAAFSGKGPPRLRRALRWGVAALALVAVGAWSLYRSGAPERDTEELIAGGAYAQAAAVAADGLARDPDNARLKSLGTAAALKATLPAWMAMLKARQFNRATAYLDATRRQARHNPELAGLLDELAWIVRLETFVAARGGAQAPIAGPADESRVRQILKQWEDQSEAHQRAFVTISSYVPQYRDAYADAVSDVRKLALARTEEKREPAAP